MAASVKPYEKITDPPTNVKEAIDWLIRIGEWDNSTSGGSVNRTNCNALQGAIQKLTGSTSRTFTTAIKDLISDLSKFLGYQNGQINGGGIIKKDGNNYTSAYNSTAAKWPMCVKGQCSCCQQGSKCNCQSGGKSCDGSCCNTCDIRICAGIFVALVPALHTALDGLKRRCDAKENNSKKINEDPIKGYFTALGFDGEQLNSALTGTIASFKLTSAIRKLEGLKKNINNAFDSKQSRPTQNGFTAPTTAVSASQATTSSPRTVREMLLWLMGLPYCQGYKEFVEKLKEDNYKNILGPTRPSGKSNENPFAKQLSAVIFQLPTVFYSVEGHISYLKEVFEQFNDKAKPRFCYPTEGDKLLNTLSAYVAVCYPILKYLMQRCDKENNNRRRQRRGTGAGTTPTDEKDGAWGYLTVSGKENKDEKGQTKASGPAQPTAPKTALRDYLVFMGFKTVNGTVTGDDLYEKALQDCFGQNVKDDEDEEKDVGATGRGPVLGRSGSTRSSKKYDKLPALRKLAKKVLQEAYGPAGAGGGAGGVSSPNGTTPTTIRQMMLWLIGLPLTTAYKGSNGTPSGTGALFGTDGVVVTEINQNAALKALEKPAQTVRRGRSGSTSNATGKHFKQQLKDSIVGMIMLFQRIEGGLGSVLDFLKGGFIDKSGRAKDKFKYDGSTNGKTIFTEFNTYVYKVHTQLRFLMVMCKTEKNYGGWSECHYAIKNYSKSSGVTGTILCRCHDGVGVACSVEPLRHFLTDDGTKNGKNKNKFQLCKDGKQEEQYQMGFKAYDPQSSSGSASTLTGASITPYLEALLDPIPTTATQPSSQSTPSSKPLSLLTQYCVAIGNMDPVSLGDHFDVFRELANGMWSKIEGEVKKEIKLITTADTDGSQASGKLQGALKAVWPGTHTPPKDHTGDLRSLTGCNGGSSNNCIPFIASLSHGLYRYFDPKLALESRNQSDVINWLYMKMSGLYGKLTALKTEMTEKCKCCPNGETKPTGCNGITQCPNCLPLMYKMGLVFGDPVTISTNKCSELMEKMKKVLDATSKLCVVFRSIDDKRFWPYLLFSARVVKGKNEKGELTVNGDENINCYTHKLGGEMYKKYLKTKKDTDTQTAQENKKARDEKLKCTCPSHPYTQPTAPQTKQVTPTTVTLTLYFQGAYITQAVTITVPHHGPLYNPLVRLYPRNLKSIVDWLLRIGQTRLGQGTSAASTNDTGLKEMCETFWPKIQECLKEKDDNSKGVFKALVEKVTTMMGLKNQGNKEVGQEVKKALKEVTEKLNKKLNGSGEGFQQTFTSILTFNPKDYIDKVIEDFGERVCKVQTNGQQKPRNFNCIAKSVSKCMNKALQTIKKLATENKNEMANYNVTGIPELNGNKIDEVQQLTSINELKKLCDGFKAFHEAYKKVEGAFNDHLQQAQSGSAKDPWTKIKQCVEAFKELGECADDISTLSSYNNASQMPTASEKLNELSTKLKDIHEKLKEDDLSTFTNEVKTYIDALDGVLKKEGEKALAVALKGKTGGQTTKFSDFLKYYVSTLIDKMKENQIGDKNKLCDIHLRVRNDLLQLSECLKVMCEVCGTGMKEFADKLKTAVDDAKGHLDEIVGIQLTLKNLNGHLHVLAHKYPAGTMDLKKLDEAREWSIRCVRRLLESEYIYQTQPIVDTLIDTEAVQKMTNYLKSLPDLIRDRYVLQKWTDDSAYFCGVQEFKGGIVKQTDTDGIKQELQDMLRDTYHNAAEVTIHEFQVRALMYNFCYKEGIKRIDCGIKVMRDVTEKINDKVEWTKIKTNKKTELLPLLTKLSDNAYLRYFATHPRHSRTYYYLCNRWSIHPLSPNLANAKTIDNYIRATQ